MSPRLDRLILLLRTVRHLRPSQVLWRLRRHLTTSRPPSEPQGDLLLVAGASPVGARWLEVEGAAPDPDVEVQVDRLLDGEVEALGRSVPLGDIDWISGHISALWTYHLHYFETLVPLYLRGREGAIGAAEQAAHLVEGWISQTARTPGEGWDPYPTSIRVIQWLKVLCMEAEGPTILPEDTRRVMLRSLHRQIAHLSGNIEWDLSANHLIKNLCGLVWGGALLARYRGPQAFGRWKALLFREVTRQVLPDGVHEERSPAYHQVVLHDLLEVRCLLLALGDPDARAMDPAIRSMMGALDRLTRPDGTFFLFGDSPNRSAPHARRIHALAGDLRPDPEQGRRGAWALPQAGFHGYRDDTCDLVLDCGPFGPLHQPGHGHCDALSFVFDVRGVPLVVDSGVHGYNDDPYREYSRSTRAHNTVMIEGQEQSEVWSVFRVARRATVRVLEPAPPSDAGGGRPLFRFAGACTGFRRNGTHHRTFTLERGTLHIADRVEGGRGGPVQSFLHLHPRWQVTQQEEGFLATTAEGHAVHIELRGMETAQVVCGAMDPVQGWYLPAMGEAHAAPVIVATAGRGGAGFGFILHDRTPE